LRDQASSACRGLSFKKYVQEVAVWHKFVKEISKTSARERLGELKRKFFETIAKFLHNFIEKF